jgi:hypothetical protein
MKFKEVNLSINLFEADGELHETPDYLPTAKDDNPDFNDFYFMVLMKTVMGFVEPHNSSNVIKIDKPSLAGCLTLSGTTGETYLEGYLVFRTLDSADSYRKALCLLYPRTTFYIYPVSIAGTYQFGWNMFCTRHREVCVTTQVFAEEPMFWNLLTDSFEQDLAESKNTVYHDMPSIRKG